MVQRDARKTVLPEMHVVRMRDVALEDLHRPPDDLAPGEVVHVQPVADDDAGALDVLEDPELFEPVEDDEQVDHGPGRSGDVGLALDDPDRDACTGEPERVEHSDGPTADDDHGVHQPAPPRRMSDIDLTLAYCRRGTDRGGSNA